MLFLRSAFLAAALAALALASALPPPAAPLPAGCLSDSECESRLGVGPWFPAPPLAE